MKLQPRKIDNKKKIQYLDTLYTAVTSLNSREETKNFLRDLLTESERIMLGRRILIAHMLLKEKSYDDIIKELGVGKDTIMRVHYWLNDQSMGYEKVVAELEKIMNKRFKSSYTTHKSETLPEPFSFNGLKRRYPLHFFLFNLINKVNNK